MRFRDLNIGQVFEFSRASELGMERGPWVKISKRKYSPWEVEHRLNGIEIRVGSWNIEVTQA